MVRVLACHVKSRGFKSRLSRIFMNIINYYNLFFFLCISILLSFIIYFLSFFLIKQKDDIDKLSAYECGFDPYNNARTVFDVKFYLVALLFIIFDLEAAFVFPWVLTLDCINSLGFWTMVEFITELIAGYIYIWRIGALEWN